ncbi:hypothetical protein [Paenibacillus chitinolyticus]|uniref:hypothetical protein n=1 Tax=Paenibacillus chitinolyticus TaxID=79263 RepID=UPI003633885F
MKNMVHFTVLKVRTEAFNNMPLVETLKWVERINSQFANEVEFLKQFQVEHKAEINELLSEETIGRYKSVARALSVPYKTYRMEKDPELQSLLEQGLLVQSWSSLGSLLESTLQMFLAFHYRDYIKSDWFKWDEAAIDQLVAMLKGNFKTTLEEIVTQNEQLGTGGLTTEIMKSFIKKTKDILRLKRRLPKIEKISLGDLIDFYYSENVLRSRQYDKQDLHQIQYYRNAIHAFQKRTIGSWDELNEHAKVLIMLMVDILNQLPEIPYKLPIPAWYYEEKSNIIMKETKWFEYGLRIDTQAMDLPPGL